MGKYLVLIYGDENAHAQAGEAFGRDLYASHVAFNEAHGPKLLGGDGLQSTESATVIRSDGADGFVVTDGPFIETKEALAGYYLVDAAELDEAIEIAKHVPAPFGGVEVRPVMVYES